MARFRATIKGNRGVASRLGSKASGLDVRANGWDTGVRICAAVDNSGADVFYVYATGGSNSRVSDRRIATIYSDGKVETHA